MVPWRRQLPHGLHHGRTATFVVIGTGNLAGDVLGLARPDRRDALHEQEELPRIEAPCHKAPTLRILEGGDLGLCGSDDHGVGFCPVGLEAVAGHEARHLGMLLVSVIELARILTQVFDVQRRGGDRGCHDLIKKRVEQPGLAVEVGIDEPHAAPGASSEPIDASSGQTVVGELHDGCLEQPPPLVLRVARHLPSLALNERSLDSGDKNCDAGHEVTAHVRNPAKVPGAWRDRVRLIVGEITDAHGLDDAVAGSDAVVSALGPSMDRKATGLPLVEGTRLIVEAMHRHGVRRYVGNGTPSVLDRREKRTAQARLVGWMGRTFLPRAYAELIQMSRIVTRPVLGLEPPRREFEVGQRPTRVPEVVGHSPFIASCGAGEGGRVRAPG